MGYRAFYDCDALTDIHIPDSVTSLGSQIFYDCDALKNVTLGTGITGIPESAFEDCDVLEELVLPYRVASIGKNAFKNIYKKAVFTVPKKAKTKYKKKLTKTTGFVKKTMKVK